MGKESQVRMSVGRSKKICPDLWSVCIPLLIILMHWISTTSQSGLLFFEIRETSCLMLAVQQIFVLKISFLCWLDCEHLRIKNWISFRGRGGGNEKGGSTRAALHMKMKKTVFLFIKAILFWNKDLTRLRYKWSHLDWKFLINAVIHSCKLSWSTLPFDPPPRPLWSWIKLGQWFILHLCYCVCRPCMWSCTLKNV